EVHVSIKDGKPSFELTPAPPKTKPKRKPPAKKKPAAKKAAPKTPPKDDGAKPEASSSGGDGAPDKGGDSDS
ncbi:MAG: hypothetical protein AAGL68_01475, partial [Pseudomonadota bacterium]